MMSALGARGGMALGVDPPSPHAAICFRNTNFCTLPVTVIGKESTNFT
jgi:hypothetical protein